MALQGEGKKTNTLENPINPSPLISFNQRVLFGMHIRNTKREDDRSYVDSAWSSRKKHVLLSFTLVLLLH